MNFKQSFYGMSELATAAVLELSLCDMGELVTLTVDIRKLVPVMFLGLLIGANHRLLSSWKPVIESQKRKLYGSLCDAAIGTDLQRAGIQQSLWWRDLLSAELFGSQPNNLVHERCEASIGELYKEDRNCSVADVGYWSEGVWHWNMSWRCPLLGLEEPDRAELILLLDGISPNARLRISGFGCWIRIWSGGIFDWFGVQGSVEHFLQFG
ncbi:hypothetical protein TSUD_12810 [Trifolium subterraneum]|uniref:Uncharacterized protein n=1 Tax=Trifolium subterraneum TaxID=3900 RepID=A0A2Z6NGP7_TRISU|nr:hypothetical protein TSUD_12810 [Trifolium subterraneum]